MRYAILLFVLVLAGTTVYGSDSLRVNLNTATFVKGDTLEFDCSVPNFAELRMASATMNVWIEDVERTHRWKFRYPMINGNVSGSLAISGKIPDGRYAVNFLIQRGFLKISGEVVDHEKKDTLLNYIMIPKNKQGSFFDNTHVGADGHFRLKSTLFEDSAYFIFSPVKKIKNNYLFIKIESPLDSAFLPVLSSLKFITVGNPKMLVRKKTDISQYVFSSEEVLDTNMLPGVTVTTKYKTKMQQYEEEYTGNLFKRDDAIVFDGLDNTEISRSTSIFQFLQGRVAGLTIEKNAEGIDIAKWRNELAEIYVDEFKINDVSEPLFISPIDVAMIKVFRPPAQLMGSGGAGAIAIYTKRGELAHSSRTRHNFIVKGYTSLDSVWQ